MVQGMFVQFAKINILQKLKLKNAMILIDIDTIALFALAQEP